MATAKKAAPKRAVYKKAAAKKAGIVLRKDGKPDRRYATKSNSKAVNNGLAFRITGQVVSLTRNGRVVDEARVDVTGTNIGCGIKQVYGLGSLNRLCQSAGRSLAPGMVAALLTNIKAKYRAAFVVLSNNMHGKYINDALDHIATSPKAKRNPGTGREVKVWTF